MALTQFLPLSYSASRLLYAIWELQSEQGTQGRGVTIKEISARLGKTGNRVSGIIHGIQKASKSYLVKTTHPRPGREGERGHPLNHYHLNQTDFVTIPETALMLMELASFPPDKKLRINRIKFVKHLVQDRKLKETELQSRVDWAIDKSYLYVSEDGSFIWPHERIDCERDYLSMLARHVI